MANVLSIEKQTAIVTALVEGCSVRSTARMTGVSKGAVLRTLVKIGPACQEYQDATIRRVRARRIASKWMKSGVFAMRSKKSST